MARKTRNKEKRASKAQRSSAKKGKSNAKAYALLAIIVVAALIVIYLLSTPGTSSSIPSGSIAPPSSAYAYPPTLVNATHLDVGQSIQIISPIPSAPHGNLYSLFTVFSATTGQTVWSYTHSPPPSNSMAYTASVAGSFKANVVFLVAESALPHMLLGYYSPSSSVFIVAAAPTLTHPVPTKTTINSGQNDIFSVTISGGTGPFNLDLVYNGVVVSMMNGKTRGVVTFPPIYPPIGKDVYSVVALDAGVSPSFVFSSASNTINVLNSSIATTTFTENGLPKGATFNVTYNSNAMHATVATTPASLQFLTPRGNYTYTIPAVTYNTIAYLPYIQNSTISAGSQVSVLFGTSQITSIPGCGKTCMGFQTTKILSEINNYLMPNVTSNTPLSAAFPPLGAYGGTSVILNCDPQSSGPICLIEFDFNSAGSIVNVTTT